MAINFSFDFKDGVLFVKTKGKDESKEEVIDYGQKVIEVAVANKAEKVLCDERELEYAIDIWETFEAADQLAEIAPNLGRVAIVCNKKFIKEGKLWQAAAGSRGLQIFLDYDYDRVINWLAMN